MDELALDELAELALIVRVKAFVVMVAVVRLRQGVVISDDAAGIAGGASID